MCERHRGPFWFVGCFVLCLLVLLFYHTIGVVICHLSGKSFFAGCCWLLFVVIYQPYHPSVRFLSAFFRIRLQWWQEIRNIWVLNGILAQISGFWTESLHTSRMRRNRYDYSLLDADHWMLVAGRWRQYFCVEEWVSRLCVVAVASSIEWLLRIYCCSLQNGFCVFAVVPSKQFSLIFHTVFSPKEDYFLQGTNLTVISVASCSRYATNLILYKKRVPYKY